MPSEAPTYPTQTEKPHHYTYLKEFRTQQCPLFLQHKCTQHRPYTCFNWHFLNQRRRRPVRKRDGTFNYNPDVYCTKYDETTGICPDGDECQYLHRTAGDTERRYHLRYYKTGNCVHETDSKGNCVKNGPHCAFAHGAHDLRQPVYDLRELAVEIQADSFKPGSLESTAATQLEKDRQVNEDPKWNDTNYVLANYKTEQCKRPPRLCRQGYACPSYHNSRDRRRSPKLCKYRSTPCPNVKCDDWGDPAQCDNGDACAYCHTRTEQQFHPEIYKSTKCNDMVQTGYCPRGPFCAFAHVEQEMTTNRELGASSDNSLAAFVNSVLPLSDKDDDKINGIDSDEKELEERSDTFASPLTIGSDNSLNNFPEPIGKGRSNSVSNSFGIAAHIAQSYGKVNSYQEDDQQPKRSQSVSNCKGVKDYLQHKNRHPFGNSVSLWEMTQPPKRSKSVSNCKGVKDYLLQNQHPFGSAVSLWDKPPVPNCHTNDSLDSNETMKTNQVSFSLMPLNSNNLSLAISFAASSASSETHPQNSVSSTMSPLATSFYPPGDTVESVIDSLFGSSDKVRKNFANTLDHDDLTLGEFSFSCLDHEMPDGPCSNSFNHSFNNDSFFRPSSNPVTIPSNVQRPHMGSLSQSPASCLSSSHSVNSLGLPSTLSNLHNSFLHHKQEQQLQDAAVAFHSQPNPGKYSAPGYSDFNGPLSPHSNSMSQSPLLNSFGVNGFDSSRILEKSSLWDDQSRGALPKFHHPKDNDHLGTTVHYLQPITDVDNLPLPVLHQLLNQLRLDMEKLDKVIYQQTSNSKCLVCKDKSRSVTVLPCNHHVMCDSCARKCLLCPSCQMPIIKQQSKLAM